MNLRKATFAFGIAVACLLAVGVLALCVRELQGRATSHEHSFSVTNAVFLTEDVALSKAQASMALEGFDLSTWVPHGDGRTVAPDGTPDLYLARSTEPNSGTIQFVNLQPMGTNVRSVDSRLVRVRLARGTITCMVIKGK
jgi:hypothetical protein